MMMIFLLAISLALLLLYAIVRWIASVPLLRTLSASIDCWAENVHGDETKVMPRARRRPL